jgi:membrane protease YdiL (CAAX protease family)
LPSILNVTVIATARSSYEITQDAGKESRLIIYLELLVVLFLTAILSLLTCFTKKDFLYDTKTLLRAIVYSLGQIFLVLYIGLQQQIGLVSVGIDLQRMDLLWAGVIYACLSILFYRFVVQPLFLREKRTFEEMGFYDDTLSVKSPLQRSLLISYVSLAAIAEELIYRGYFILIWGQRINSPILCATISSIIFIILHLYRGKKTIPYYTTITIFLVIPTLYANTILISVGMHIFVNLAATIGIWVREERRLKKESETSSQIPNGSTIPRENPTPNSRIAIILFICSWFAALISLFLYAIPSALIIILVTCDMIRINKSRGRIVGVGFCIATIIISTFPILALAAFFLLPKIFALLFSA